MHIPGLNIDKIALESIEPVSSYMAPSIGQIDKTQWKPTYEMVGLSLPDIIDIPSIKRKFKIQVTVHDHAKDKDFTKTIFFGNDDDYVFTKNKTARLKKLYSLKHHKNALHPDYWRAHICFSGDDWIQNTLELAKQYLMDRSQLLGNLKPKKDFTPLIKKREATIQQKKKE